MYTIKPTEPFVDWLNSLKDKTTQQRLNARLRKAMQGNLGDVKPVGDGVSECVNDIETRDCRKLV